MEIVTGKFLRGMRKAVAVTIAAAMAVSALSTVPQAEAASVKKPTISVKKKTLYYNKAGKKTFTLKIKKNNTKRITKTTWKTSKKSVIAISKKTKTSVKLTAKKKGTSTISAVVKYIPKGSKKVKKVKLTCKVTSKAAATAKPTPKKTKSPKKSPTPKPTEEPDESEEPEETDTPESPAIKGQAASVDLMASVFLSTAAGKNTANLSAVIKDSAGNIIDDEDIIWTSDNETVAKVDDSGVVTAVSDGTANVTAKVGEVSSKPCLVTVDSVAPAVKEVKVSDYKTITVYFSEKVKGEPKVSVAKGESKEALNNITAALSENGMSVSLTTSEESLAAAVYKLSVSGITDLSGNELQGGSDLSVEKEKSVMAGFVGRIDTAPASQKEIKVYYKVTDQYNQSFDVMSDNNLSVSAKTEGGMPLSAEVTNDGKTMGYVTVSGTAGIFTVGRKITITLTNKVSDTVSYTGDITVSLVDASGMGVAKDFSKLYVTSEKLANEGTGEAPIFQLNETRADNIFTLNADLLDEFLYPANSSEVTYVLSDTDVIKFEDTTEKIKTSDGGVSFEALKGGTTTVTAYLVNDDTKTKQIKIQIKPTKLQKIYVAEIEDGINGRTTETEVSFEPIGTGLTDKDLYIEYTENEERVDKDKSGLVSVADETGNTKIYARITAKTDGKNGDIKFRVCYKGGTEESNVRSDEVSYKSKPLSTVASIEITPFDANEVTVDGDAETEFKLKNTYGEDITAVAGKQPEAETDPAIIKITSIGGEDKDYNKLKVTGVAQGDAKITVFVGNIRKTINVSVAEAAKLKKIEFDKDQKEKDIIICDNDVIYVDLKAYNQFNNPYTLKYKDLNGKVVIENGTEVSEDLIVGFYQKNADNNYTEKSGDDDVVDAVGIKWNDVVRASSNDKLKIKIGIDDVASDIITLTVKPARVLSKLTFEKSEVIAVAGASVSNTVTGTDQYGEKIDLSGYTITPVIKDSTGNKLNSIIKTSISNSQGKTVICTAPQNSGKYSVTVEVKDSNDAKVTLSPEPKFNLVVGTVLELVKKIELEKVVTVSGTPYDTSKYFVDLRGGQKTIQYSYKLYDKDNKEIQCGEAALQNNLSWSYQDAKGVTVSSVNADGISVKKEGAEDGSVTVKLSCMAGELLTTALPIRVSAKDDEVQGNEYMLKRIVPDGEPVDMSIPDDGSGKIEINGNYEFSVYATNQYGQKFAIDKTKMIGAISASPDIAGVTVSDDGVIGIRSLAAGEAKVIVYVTEEKWFEFTAAVSSIQPSASPSTSPSASPSASASASASASPSTSASASPSTSASASPSASPSASASASPSASPSASASASPSASASASPSTSASASPSASPSASASASPSTSASASPLASPSASASASPSASASASPSTSASASASTVYKKVTITISCGEEKVKNIEDDEITIYKRIGESEYEEQDCMIVNNNDGTYTVNLISGIYEIEVESRAYTLAEYVQIDVGEEKENAVIVKVNRKVTIKVNGTDDNTTIDISAIKIKIFKVYGEEEIEDNNVSIINNGDKTFTVCLQKGTYHVKITELEGYKDADQYITVDDSISEVTVTLIQETTSQDTETENNNTEDTPTS